MKEKRPGEKRGAKPAPLVNLIGTVTIDRNGKPRKLSERRLVNEIASLTRDPAISSSHLTRSLNGDRQFDPKIVKMIGAVCGRLLNLDSRVAEQATLAEYNIWLRGTIVPVRYNATPVTTNLEIRAPVVRRELFREIRTRILYSGEEEQRVRVVTIGAALDQQLGRSAFALSVGQYCGFDAPIEVRRTLLVSSLAHIHHEEGSGQASESTGDESIDVQRIAGRISATLSLARRLGGDLVASIARSLHYVSRPLLLIKDTSGVRDQVLGDFLRELIGHLPDDSDLIVLIAAQHPLNKNGEQSLEEAFYPLDYFSPSDFAAYIIWKLNADHGCMTALMSACSGIRSSLRKPSVATLLAGSYLLKRPSCHTAPGASAPWAWFDMDTAAADSPLRQQEAPRNAGSNSVVTGIASIVERINLRDVEQSEEFFHAIITRSLNGDEQTLLQALAIFSGPFSAEAALACYVAARGTGKPHRLNLYADFEPLLNRLCLSGAVIVERVSQPSSFRMEAEVRDWLRNLGRWDRLSGGGKALSDRAKRGYLDYIQKQVDSALDYLALHPHAIDPASQQAFLRPGLEAEAFHIDTFLREIWSVEENLSGDRHDEESRRLLPAVTQSDLPDLTEDLRQRVWLWVFVANLALFWEAADLPFTAATHLNIAIEDITKRISPRAANQLTRCQEGTKQQIHAIRAQLLLSNLLLEIRQRRKQLSLEECEALLLQARDDLAASGSRYEYGHALFDLASGMLANRNDSSQGIGHLVRAAQRAEGLADEDVMTRPQEALASHILLMAQKRLPLARFLVFSAQRERASAEMNAGGLDSAIQTNEMLLQASMYAREPRLIADALLGMSRTYWCRSALAGVLPFTESSLRQVRDLLFQFDGYLSALRGDRETFQAHYVILLGLYHIEKESAVASPHRDKCEPPDLVQDRADYGEDLIFTGLSKLNDIHWHSFYCALLADSYLRGSTARESDREDNGQRRSVTDRALAVAYFIRSLQSTSFETRLGFSLSIVIRRLYRRFYEKVGEREIQHSMEIHRATEGDGLGVASTIELLDILRQA